jgi:16S rRNA (cytosine1402-N4)-methyltransferase
MTPSTSDLHTPVMLERCLALLRPALLGDHPVVLDCTLGLGGHSQALLEANPNLRVIGIDRDPRAIELSRERLSGFGVRFSAHLAVYDQIREVLDELGISKLNGVLMDLGVSSMQLDEAARGFSYAKDAALDMRMDQSFGLTAADILAHYSEEELTGIFRRFGEERFSGPIAKRIVQDRKLSPITTSLQLNKIVTQIVPSAPGKTAGHPAKRIYQALRIAANDELGALQRSLPQALEVLAPKGRIVVMSYHSLEDGIVKQALQAGSVSSTPIDLPFELPGTGAILKIITKGAERAGEIELSANPRAASARLRAAEKLEVKE